MNAIYWLSILLFVAGSSQAGTETTEHRYHRYLKLLGDYFSQPRHPVENSDSWLRTRQGVLKELKDTTSKVRQAKVEVHKFKTELIVQEDVPAEVEGENIIVTFQGEHFGTGKDSILVIGAHYDSDANTHGIDDNGSGMVALLESARHLASAISERGARLLDTVIFVAFDVLEHEGARSEEYQPGSYYFVQEKLGPMLGKASAPEFRGAIILDSVLNFNDSVGSQTLPQGFDTSFKEAHEWIAKNQNRGNFLTMVTKERLRSLQLDNAFSEHWNTVNPAQSQKSPLVALEVRRALQSPALFEFLKQDHLAFWNYVQGDLPKPLAAILITDTGKFRGMSNACRIGPCDIPEMVDAHRLALLDHVIATINRFIFPDGLPSGSATSHVTSVFVTLLSAICLVLLIR